MDHGHRTPHRTSHDAGPGANLLLLFNLVCIIRFLLLPVMVKEVNIIKHNPICQCTYLIYRF